ncbi:hypothetical protein BH11PSE10_BH11PSE10_21850 [soil metagenome]
MIGLLLALAASFAKGEHLMAEHPEHPDPADPSAALQLVQQLANPDPVLADAAVARIFHVGAQLTPQLLGLRGQAQPFMGFALLNPRASMLLPRPTPGQELPPQQKYRVVTVEAAALYLVCAIQRGELHFSRSALLTDPAEPVAQRLVANTPERLDRAFLAAQAWLRLNAADGSRAVTAGLGDPIAASGLRWY